MGTRAQVRFATRQEGQSFNQHPSEIHAQFYVHSDGYPEYLGVEIANSLEREQTVDSWEIESLDTKHGDLEYIYYIWQAPSKDTFISIFKTNINTEENQECIFVGEPQKLLEKYD
tara:strand:+ start:317 stop:661 length:345 start_codon:yes stop_codon:yes gene_type:complete